MNFFLEQLHELCEVPDFLPFNAGRSKSLEISIKIPGYMELSCEDDLFGQFIRILSSSVRQIYKEYAEEYYFHKPNLILNPVSDRDCCYLTIEVWMMDKKIWDEMKKNEK